MLYTEMVTTGALLHGPRDRLLQFDSAEQPVALQLGGSEPDDLAVCARMAEDLGYSEINLNVGCPSERVQRGAFGACLMREPKLVGECVAKMKSVVRTPVTVKCRIGIDQQDPMDVLFAFVEQVKQSGCAHFIVHARNAWLKGLSPKENRDIPPLNYDVVYELKKRYPELTICINGGITAISAAQKHLEHVDGVMMGRAAYQTPWILADVDAQIFGTEPPAATRADIIEGLVTYIERELNEATPLNAITRHVLGLCNGLPGARGFRRLLSEQSVKRGAGPELLRTAFGLVGADELERIVA